MPPCNWMASCPTWRAARSIWIFAARTMRRAPVAGSSAHRLVEREPRDERQSSGPARATRTCPRRGTAAPGRSRSGGRTARGSSGSRRSATASGPSRRPPPRTASRWPVSSTASSVVDCLVRAAEQPLQVRRRRRRQRRAGRPASDTSRRTPATSASTRNRPTVPSGVRAVTTNWSALSPPSTAIFSRVDGPRVADRPRRRRRGRSATSANPVRCARSAQQRRAGGDAGQDLRLLLGRPGRATSDAPSTTVARYGSSTSDRPNDSITTASSPTPIPAPPYCSSKVRPSSPISAYCCHMLAAPASSAEDEQPQPGVRVVALVEQAVDRCPRACRCSSVGSQSTLNALQNLRIALAMMLRCTSLDPA